MHTCFRGGKRDGLRVIAGGKCNYAALLFFVSERKDPVGGAANFESTYALQVLAFEKEVCAGPLVSRS